MKYRTSSRPFCMVTRMTAQACGDQHNYVERIERSERTARQAISHPPARSRQIEQHTGREVGSRTRRQPSHKQRNEDQAIGPWSGLMA